jgi:hypothetical protein
VGGFARKAESCRKESSSVPAAQQRLKEAREVWTEAEVRSFPSKKKRMIIWDSGLLVPS